MIAQVTMYRTDDGRKFDTEDEALAWEAEMALDGEFERMMVPPMTRDQQDMVSSGKAYMQLTEKVVEEYAAKLMEAIIAEKPGLAGVIARHGIETYFVGRTLDDSGSALYRPFLRLLDVDGQKRLWGQSYYKNNPPAGAVEISEAKGG